MFMVGDTDLTFTMPTKVAVRTMRVSVVMLVPMRRRRVFWLRKATLFAHLLRFSHLVVKCIPTPGCVRGKALHGMFIHMACQWNLRMLHA